MLIKGVKPRTHLLMDLLLFGLLVMVVGSLFMERAALRAGAHAGFMFHALHEISGIMMCIVIGVHLLMHTPWIRSQLPRLFGG